MAKSIYINLDANNLRSAAVRSDTDLRSARFSQFVAGDSVDFNLYVVDTSGLQNIQNYASVRLGIGGSDSRPNAGSYTVASTNTLVYNHTAAELKEVIDSAVDVATVTELAPFVFKIQFTNNGEQSIPNVDGRLLNPRSTVDVSKMITGNSTTPETWLWRLYRNPLAFTDTFTNISGQGITGTVDFNTSGIYDLISNEESEDTFLEVEVTDSSGSISTIAQIKITIFGEVIGQSFNGSVPTPSGSLPAEASTFLQSFPNPDVAGSLTVDGGLFVEGLFTPVSGVQSKSGDFKTGGKIITGEIQCPGDTADGSDADPINYDAKEHRFRDFDADPTNLMVIKKIDGTSTGARVGINKDTADAALHIVAGQDSSGDKDLALKVIGGAYFNEYIRVGTYTNTTRDQISPKISGLVIYNLDTHKYQAWSNGSFPATPQYITSFSISGLPNGLSGVYTRNGETNHSPTTKGKRRWQLDGDVFGTIDVAWSGTKWEIRLDGTSYFSSTEDTLDPWDVTSWSEDGGMSGTPTFSDFIGGRPTALSAGQWIQFEYIIAPSS